VSGLQALPALPGGHLVNAETRRMIDRGEWWDGDVEEWLQIATEQWDEAPQSGQWSLDFDAADLSRILRELKARRDAEGDA
jgi:hypothetical protein